LARFLIDALGRLSAAAARRRLTRAIYKLRSFSLSSSSHAWLMGWRPAMCSPIILLAFQQDPKNQDDGVSFETMRDSKSKNGLGDDAPYMTI
jgi:hypothetical protein